MINKQLIATLAMAGVVFGVYARHLTPQEALDRVGQSGPMSVKGKSILNDKIFVPVFEISAKESGEAMVYVFGSTDKKGFMILSGDDIAKPVLGYSENEEFNSADIPVNMREWLDGYAREIEWATTHSSYTPIGFVKKAESTDFAPIEPLVKTRWNQSVPYNDRCPILYSRRSVTGCLATAEAQVMKYHNWPEKATGTISYKWVVGAKTLEADLDTIPLNWNLMLDDYNDKGTDEEKLAVANLMLACGLASQMNYSTSASSATSVAGAQGFFENFGCTEAGLILRDWYNPDDWNQYVYNYLTEHGPLLYCGQSDSGGHAFVCDGYRGNGFYHFNWGWGGMSDGYFQLSALNPGSQGIGGTSSGYNYSQQLIPGLYKPGEIKDFNPVFAADAGIIIEEDWNTVMGDTVMVTTGNESGGFWNFSMATIPVTFGLKFVRNATGEELYKECYGIVDRELPQMRGWRSFPMIIPEGLSEGTYTVTPAVNPYGNGWREMQVSQQYPTYVLMTVKGDSVLFDRPQPAPILIDQIEFGTPVVAGGGFTLKARATALGDRKFYGNVTLVLGEFFGEDFVADFQAAPVMISARPGEYEEFSFAGTFTNQRLKGEYQLVFINSDNGEIISNPVTVNVAPYPGVPVIEVLDAKIIDADGVNPNDVKVNFDLKCTSGYFSESLFLTVFEPGVTDQYEYLTRFASSPVYVLKDNSENVTFGGGVAAEEGSIFEAYVQSYNSKTRKYVNLAGPLTFTIGKSGVQSVKADASDSVHVTYDAAAGCLVVKVVGGYEIAGIDVFAANGALVSSEKASTDTKSIDVNHLSDGVYIVKVTLSDGTTSISRFAK